MEWLSEKKDTFFLGRSVKYSGNAIYNTLKTLPEEKRIELPVFEEIQMGMSTGMAMNGLVPISCFPRFDFVGSYQVIVIDVLFLLQSLIGHVNPRWFYISNRLLAEQLD